MSIMELDTRGYETNDVNSVVLRTFDSLPVGEKMVLINDADPSHVFNQLEEKRFGKFEWEYIEEGPDIWKVSLAKKYLNYNNKVDSNFAIYFIIIKFFYAILLVIEKTYDI